MTQPGRLSRWLDGVDALVDRLSTQRMKALTGGLRRILPGGFWGDHLAGEYNHERPGDQRVYLTFDDGPSPDTTPALLELLREFDARATFFLVGSQCERYPELVREIAADGHALGNHSWSHNFLPGLSRTRMQAEIDATQELIGDITGGARPKVFRPPFGLMNRECARHLKVHDLSPVYWTSAPEDWQIPGARRVVRRVLHDLFSGSVIVLHEGDGLGKQTLEAVKEILYSCKQRNLALEEICLTSNRPGTTL